MSPIVLVTVMVALGRRWPSTGVEILRIVLVSPAMRVPFSSSTVKARRSAGGAIVTVLILIVSRPIHAKPNGAGVASWRHVAWAASLV